jgi:hypothetical protein
MVFSRLPSPPSTGSSGSHALGGSQKRSGSRVRIGLAATLALVIIGWVGGSARAQLAHHTPVEVKPWKEKGKVVGAIFKTVLKPGGGHNEVRVSLVPVGRTYQGWDHMKAAADPAHGVLLHQFPPAPLSGSEPIEQELRVRYGEGNRLVGGETVEVVTAWRGGTLGTGQVAAGDLWHTWGMTRIGLPPQQQVTLPKADPKEPPPAPPAHQ